MKKKNGFTLIELLVAIAIIAILTGVSIVGLNSTRNKAKDTARLSHIRQLQIALEAYWNINGKYPPAGVQFTEDYIVGLAPAYISKLPQDPNGLGYYTYGIYLNDQSYCFNEWLVYNPESQPLLFNPVWPNSWHVCGCSSKLPAEQCAPSY